MKMLSCFRIVVAGLAFHASVVGAQPVSDARNSVASHPKGTPIATLLDERGHLALPAGFVGSIDPNGYSLVSGNGEAPRFVHEAESASDDSARWANGFGNPGGGCSGPVNALALAPDGSLLLGGVFTECNGVAANRIVRWDPATGLYTSLGTGAANGVDDIVHAIAVSGSDVYVGGRFSNAGGIPARRVARWDGVGWSSLGTGTANGVTSAPGFSTFVLALAISGSDLYVGGIFVQAGEVSAPNIARWNGTSWFTVGGGVSAISSSSVSAITVLGGDIIVGGGFSQAGQVPANSVARWNGSSWSSLGAGTANGVGGNVNALAVSGNDLYVAGSFGQAGEVPAIGIARWDGSSWTALGSEGANGVNGQALSVAVSGSNVFLAGTFSLAGGESASRVARWNGSVWSSLGSGSSNGVDNWAQALAISGNDVYVGGIFNHAGGLPVNQVARWNGNSWSPLVGNDSANGLDSTVFALAVSTSGIYVGGNFLQAGGVPANRVAFWNGSAWSSLGSGAANGVSGSFPTVFALAVAGSDVYVGGAFSHAGGLAVNNVARWSGGAWTALGIGVTGEVRALVTSGSDVYAGGAFTQAGGATANHVARWTGSAWQSLGSGAANGVSAVSPSFAIVNALVVAGSDVYVGGEFSSAGELAANNVARWNGSTWFSLGAGAANGVSGIVRTLNVLDGNLYVGGEFTQAGGANSNRIASWNGGTWSSLGSGPADGLNGSVRDLAIVGSQLYVSGIFTQAGGAAANRIARWDGVAWEPLGIDLANGVNNSVFAVGVMGGGVFLGGGFTLAGGKAASRFTRYDARRDTSASLNSNANPSISNGLVALTASISAFSFPNPSGTVAFRDGAEVIPGCGTVSLVGGLDTRTATCNTSVLPVGSRSITAQYAGDALNFSNTSEPLVQVVNAPTITINTNLTSFRTGVGYNISLAASGTGSIGPFDFVITSGQLPFGLNLGLNGSLTGSPTSAGPFEFEVTATDKSSEAVGGPFSGVRSYSVTVALQTSSTSIGTITPAPAVQHQQYTVPVTVTGQDTIPTGTVTVSDGTGASCQAPLASGSGSCLLVSTTAGTKTITATYPQQGVHAASNTSKQHQVLPGTQTSAIVSAADRIGQRDRLVTVPISIRGEGSTVKFSARMQFDPNQFQSVELYPIAPATCTLPAANQVEVSTLGGGRILPLPQIETPYCDVVFRLKSNPATQIDLTIDPGTTSCVDAGNNSQPCDTRNGKILVTSLVTQPPDGTNINIAGYQGQASETRILIFSNVGTAPISVTSCQVTGPGFSLNTPPATPIAPGGSSSVLVQCALDPFPGTRSGGLLQCSSSDPVRSSLTFGLSCTTVPEGAQLPGDQVFNNQLKQGDEFGRAAAVSDEGGGTPTAKGAATNQLMVIGAPNAGSDSAGRVFIFEGDLTPKALAKAGKPIKGNGLAQRLELGAMRLMRVVGPPLDQELRTGKLTIGDKFGSAVAIAPTGDRIAVGAPLAGSGDRGQVFIYDEPVGGWGELNVELTAVPPIDAPPPDGLLAPQEFGTTLAFTPGGDLVIGAPGTDSIASTNIGVIYFYESNGAGYTSSPLRTGSPNAVANGRFGAALAANDDMIVVGAPQEGAGNSQAGAAYMLPLANGLPTLPERFLASVTTVGDKFGSSVSVGGGLVIVGAANDDAAGTDSGSATVFRPPTSGTTPIEVTTLAPAAGNNQGTGMAVATNGDVILLGAPLSGLDGAAGRGRVYLYEIEPAFITTAGPLPTRPPRETLLNSGGEANDLFGGSVAANRYIAVAGVPLDDRIIDEVPVQDIGRADPFALERIFRADFE